MDEIGIIVTIITAIGGAWLTVKIREAKMHEKIIYVEKEQARIESEVKELRKETKQDMTEIYQELKAVREGIDFIKGRMSK